MSRVGYQTGMFSVAESDRVASAINPESLADRLTIVIVTFNSARVLKPCLETIPAAIPVIVVDNASDDIEIVRRLVAQRHGLLIENKSNIGYGGACNQGAELARTDYVLFLNPDVTLTSDTLTNLLRAADRRPSHVAFNPRMLTRGRLTPKRRSILLPRAEFFHQTAYETDQDVPVLSGAAFLVRRLDFLAVDGFDPNIVMYHEDDDLSVRLRRERGPLMWVHDAVVEHEGGASTERNPKIQSLKSYEMGRSRVYVARKHGLPSVTAHSLLAALVQFLNPFNLLSARKRAKAPAYLRGILAGLRDGLKQ